MKVLITGGAGYIGTELTYALGSNDAVEEIIIYDNLSRGNYNLFIGVSKLNNKVRFVEGDLLDTRKLTKVVNEADVVYHLAAKVTTPFADQNAHFFEQVNHWGTSELVAAVENSDVKKFVYVSSVSVYGSSNDEVDVDSPINPRTFYGISKMRGEEHVNRLFGKIPTYIFRCGNVYGYSKSMRFDAVINKFMFDANYKGRISINGNGEQHRSFIHIDTASQVLANLVTSSLRSSRYDLVERVVRVNDIAETMMEIFDGMEMIFVNQHLKLREIKVKPNPVVNALANLDGRTLEEELRVFKDKFTFW